MLKILRDACFMFTKVLSLIDERTLLCLQTYITTYYSENGDEKVFSIIKKKPIKTCLA